MERWYENCIAAPQNEHYFVATNIISNGVQDTFTVYILHKFKCSIVLVWCGTTESIVRVVSYRTSRTIFPQNVHLS